MTAPRVQALRARIDELERAGADIQVQLQAAYETLAELAPDDDEDDTYPRPCSNALGHDWEIADPDEGGDGRCYCLNCGADGDA